MQVKVGLWVLGVLLVCAAFYFAVTQVEVAGRTDLVECGNAIGTSPSAATADVQEACDSAVMDRRVLSGFLVAGGAMSTLIGFGVGGRTED